MSLVLMICVGRVVNALRGRKCVEWAVDMVLVTFTR
jgi:hypothetical protein